GQGVQNKPHHETDPIQTTQVRLSYAASLTFLISLHRRVKTLADAFGGQKPSNIKPIDEYQFSSP
ncbi:MAG: hypothetical protein WB610_18265, partial [Rhodomicrobium sp.]